MTRAGEQFMKTGRISLVMNHPAIVASKTGKPVYNQVMGIFNPQIEDYTWININSIPQLVPGEEHKFHTFTTFEDITKRKKAEDALISLSMQFSAISGHELFKKVVKHLADTLNHDYVFIGELQQDNQKR